MTRGQLVAKRAENPVRTGLNATGLYHSFSLPDGSAIAGAMPLDWQLKRLDSYNLPANLNGKTVLDIGPWDGFFSFELEKRGAVVTAVDYVDLDTFRRLHLAYGSKVRYERMDIYELSPERIGTFDIVLCLGVLYHLKHPLLGLEKVCSVTKDLCIIDTFVVDGGQYQSGERALPSLEFYETTELSGQLDNWSGPTVSAVEALARSAGFARSEVKWVTDHSATVAAWRKWSGLSVPKGPPAEISGLTCHAHRGRSFTNAKEEYMEIWCKWMRPEAPPLACVFVEVDGLGVPSLAATVTENGLVVNVRVLPGLQAGKHELRIRMDETDWSEATPFYYDLEPWPGPIEILLIQDGVTWNNGQVDYGAGGWMTIWVAGISEEADSGNTTVFVDGIPHSPRDVMKCDQTGAFGGPGKFQINLALRPLFSVAEYKVEVVHRGSYSNSTNVTIKGSAPLIRGLESLGPLQRT